MCYIKQQTDYYPDGLPMASTPGWTSRRRFGGKEFEDHHDLDIYTFEARTLTSSVCLFTRPDDQAHDYTFQNPYLYCAANPIAYTDPTGEDIYRFDEKTGEITFVQATKDPFDQIGVFDYNEKTNKYELKTDSKGNTKTKIDKIEKGILKDGINFIKDNNVFDIGGADGVTATGIYDFAEKLHNLIGKEIAGVLFESEDGTGKVLIGKYENNKSNRSNTPEFRDIISEMGINLNTIQKNYPNRTHWHTHPRIGNAYDSPTEASEIDFVTKSKNKTVYNRFLFIHREGITNTIKTYDY